MGKDKSDRGRIDFEKYYHDLYLERWPGLKAALCSTKKSVALENPFAPEALTLLQSQGATRHSHLPLIWLPKTDQDGREELFANPVEHKVANGLLPYYLLDEASVWSARSLNIKKKSKVLDVCAAPGGKALALLFWTQGEIQLTVGDVSRNRMDRLKRNFQSYLPPEIMERVVFHVGDGKNWFSRPGQIHFENWPYVLLDVPCSSERHVLASTEHLADWKKSRTKHLAKDQFSLMNAAWSCLAPGGMMVYSTCSISPLENQDNAELFFKKRIDAETVLEVPWPPQMPFENMSKGHLIFPDTTGLGPLYILVLKKRPA